MNGFSGVKQAEFDTMASKHTQAAGQLEELAQKLHRELQGAGLDTAPASRLRKLAAQVTTQAEDLRRRQKLVHELQRQKVAFGRSTPAGNYVELPDRLEAAKGLLDGTLAGRAASKVADGDEKALAELEKYASRTGDSEFVKAFLGTIGARGVTRMSGSLATMLRDAVTRGDSDRKNRLSTSGRNVLSTLSTALAKGTNPKDPAYQGDDFLEDLVKEGRAQHGADGRKYLGYQAQALIWRAHDGEPPYSKEFMEVVGRDVIVYEREQREDTWAASKDWLGRTFGTGAQVPIVDLAGSLSLGALLRPGAPTKGPVMQKSSSMVENLFHAAKSSREASHALLDHTPPGWDESVLHYLLTTRWGASQYLDDYEPINEMLITATTGQDATSYKLAARVTKILSNEARAAFQSNGEQLEIKDREVFYKYAPLSYALSRAISANIDQLSELYLNHATWDGVAPEDMSYALVLAGSNNKGFEALVRAQTEHMRAALNGAPPVGLNASNAKRFGFSPADVERFDLNGNGYVDKSDTIQFLKDRAAEEATPFNQIVETRRQALIAQGLDDKKADEELKGMVADAIGLLPVPGAKQAGTLAAGTFGELIGKGYEHLAGVGYDKLGEQVALRMSADGRDLDETYRTLADNRLGTERLAEQMLATSLLTKGALDGLDLEGGSFTTGNPPRIKPFSTMSTHEYSQYLAWARTAGGSSEIISSFENSFRQPSKVHDYLDLDNDSSSGGGT
ncbi:hypothetical protein [Nonomuraea harbinensis]|uniref:EF-hand domain-containing protein n=1 Tax=Nonomuraea harbinensis TaxID=1286938 RepID=A0ABW1BTQ9_9ACTN|nr:hypothetical protein [Nonomuraea harbinensis]